MCHLRSAGQQLWKGAGPVVTAMEGFSDRVKKKLRCRDSSVLGIGHATEEQENAPPRTSGAEVTARSSV